MLKVHALSNSAYGHLGRDSSFIEKAAK